MVELGQTPMTMFLFGDRNPEISAVMDDSQFQRLVRKLFAEDTVAFTGSPSIVEAAERCGLVRRSRDRVTTGPRLVTIPSQAEVDLPTVMRPTLANYVEITREVISELRLAYERTSPSRRFGWPQVSHSVVAGMFLDLAMGNEVYGSGQVSRRPVGDTVVWAFEGISARNAYGVQWTPGSQRMFYAQLWHRGVQRKEIRCTSALVDLLGAIAFGNGATPAAKELLYFRHLGLVRKAGTSFQVEIPAFGPADTGILLPVLIEGARRLVTDAIAPALDSLVHHPWWREKFQQDAYRHAAVRLVLEYGIDRVILSGVLEPFPERQDLPVEWGRWLWAEPEGQLTLMPNIKARQNRETSS